MIMRAGCAEDAAHTLTETLMRYSLTFRSLLCTIAALVASHAATVFAQEADADVADASPQRETLVYAARGVPARELAGALVRLADREDLTVGAEPVTNHLILNGPVDIVRAMTAVLERIDRQPRRIEAQLLLVELRDVDVELADGGFDDYAESLRKLEADGGATILTRVRLTTLDNQAAQVQVGGQKAVVAGGNFDPRRGRINSYVMDQEGLLVTVTPRASDDGVIALQLSVEETRIEDPPAPSAENPDEISPPGKSTAVVNTTVSVNDGETLTISDIDQGRNDSNRRVIVVVTARVLE